ncbi:phosphoglucomutase and phosphomannomutase phosphoserine signature [Lucifera butyrica]|uniref:phosphoglucomutase (alpha-D-glucose-1,6-bisphosphate-dependent) n=1 Tax=Lucifera butyrica TaxID=1351585 RepID=A0A498RD31_9FIRM|nr:phospho-sugar mutase [Lucifera butyrica]VBB07088.1 phosphoglucomutase and phosphomannomutase phosphoserine signature [Lucifera butyrica]
MSFMQEYERWLNSAALSEAEREELAAIQGDVKEIESRFYAPLEFGTAGLRGILGTGLNRMNIHTVRQATQGIASLITGLGPEACRRGVAVCMDCRIKSDVFSQEVACVLAANGIQVYLFDALRPTPELSFAVRYLNCIAGVNITASHNPKEYNGYKVYWEDGAQIPPSHAATVVKAIEDTDIFTGIQRTAFPEALAGGGVRLIGAEIDEAFLGRVLELMVNKEVVAQAAGDFKLVYTPFHGTGYKLIPEALRRLGMKEILCVPEQMVIDGTFPTVKSPNPENEEGFALAIALAQKENVDLIIGTDPDADRIGIMLKDKSGRYVRLSGNQVGVLLLDYIIASRREKGLLPAKPVAIKTIVTTEMARKVGESNGIPVVDTFTGFKFMAEKIKQLAEDGNYQYLLAYEESYGYLMGDYCRDKDAVTATLMVTEMAAYYHRRGMTLYDAMAALYEKYGHYGEYTENLVMPGLDGLAQMQALMKRLRETPPAKIAGTAVTRIRDYLTGETVDAGTREKSKMELSGSNVLYFELADATRFIVRPSGTEPKIKVYILAQGETAAECQDRVDRYSRAIRGVVGVEGA